MRILRWAIGIGIVLVLGTVIAVLKTRSRRGPESPTGLTTKIELSDCWFGPGADYYADVTIRNSKGNEIVRWQDPEGQDSSEGVNNLIHSMKWVNEKTLTFRTNEGEIVELSIP